MDLSNEDWLTLLRIGASMSGATSPLGSAQGAVPSGVTMSGSDVAPNLTGTLPTVPPTAPDLGGVPGIPGVAPPYGPPPPPVVPRPKTNLGLPQQAPLTPDAVNVQGAVPPPLAPGASPPGALPANSPEYPFKYADKPIGTENTRTWWQRNISDPWDKATTEDPKTGISPAQKALAGMGSTAGGVLSRAGAGGSAQAPLQGQAYRPAAAMSPGQLSQARAQELALLKKRAMTTMPWLRRPNYGSGEPGLMG